MVFIETENLDSAFLDCALNIYLRVGKRVAALVQTKKRGCGVAAAEAA